MHSSISWGYIYINDDEFNPKENEIELKDDISYGAYKNLEKEFPELCNALFSKSSEKILNLEIPFIGYLGTDSRDDNELILRAFFDDNSSTVFNDEDDKIKPIYLSKDKIDKKAYRLFCQVIKDVFDYGEDYGYLQLGFDELRGYVAYDGDNEWEANIYITEQGGEWS